MSWARVLCVGAVLALSACGSRGAEIASAPSSTPAPTVVAASDDQGRILFRNKGCITCHVNSREGGPPNMFSVGPDLSAYSNDPAFLRRWLKDPPAVKPGTQMPNLRLSDEEIESLIAFLNQPR